VAPEKGGEVGNPPVVNVGVRPGQAPGFRILAESRLHVFMNENLKINANGPESPYQNIRAHSAFQWNVTSWICDLFI
jgi:hypothetical protein